MTQLNAIKFIGMNLKWKEIFMDQNCSFFFVKIIIIIIVVVVVVVVVVVGKRKKTTQQTVNMPP